MEDWPKYVCAIIRDAEGRLLLEERPQDARLAAGRLTCFGGGREADETPEECLRRELREELNWEPRALHKQVELWVAGESIAWFFETRLDVSLERLQVHHGHRAVLVVRDDLANLPISRWHRLVLEAWLRSETTVRLLS